MMRSQKGPGGSAAENSVLSIADIMLTVNAPDGVRGTLMKALEKEPADQRQWDRVRANAALIVEARKLLQTLRPPKGKLLDWQEQTKIYSAIAENMVAAAERRDSSRARLGLKELKSRCTLCHEKHR